jgi:hypothetical protein
LIERDKRSLFRSSSSSKLTGWTDEEFDESLKTNFHPDDLAYIQELKQKTFTSQEFYYRLYFELNIKKDIIFG